MKKDLIIYSLVLTLGVILGFYISNIFDIEDKKMKDQSANTTEIISTIDRNTTDSIIKDREDLDNEEAFDFSSLFHK